MTPGQINGVVREESIDNPYALKHDEYMPKTPKEPIIIDKNPAAVALGRLGGLKGGKARADALSPARRKAIAKKAAEKRWGKKK